MGSAMQVGKLFKSVQNSYMDSAVQSRVKQLGGEANSTLSSAIIHKATGERLTHAESKAFSSSSVADQVAQEYISVLKGDVTNDNFWAYDAQIRETDLSSETATEADPDSAPAESNILDYSDGMDPLTIATSENADAQNKQSTRSYSAVRDAAQEDARQIMKTVQGIRSFRSFLCRIFPRRRGRDTTLPCRKKGPEHQLVANYIASNIGTMYTIIESGQGVYIGKDIPNEYSQSKYTKNLLAHNRGKLKVKNTASAGLGEMIEIATNRRWEQTKHAGNKDASYGVYRYDTKFGFPVLTNKETLQQPMYMTPSLLF